ncbi:MAG: hypothetical protein AAF485_15830 [Chloroflexota bacterium]
MTFTDWIKANQGKAVAIIAAPALIITVVVGGSLGIITGWGVGLVVGYLVYKGEVG